MQDTASAIQNGTASKLVVRNTTQPHFSDERGVRAPAVYIHFLKKAAALQFFYRVKPLWVQKR